MATRFDGRLFAQQKLDQVAQQTAAWSLQVGRRPKLVSLFPYEDHASVMYTKLKQKDAESVGVEYEAQPLSLRAPRQEWLTAVHAAARHPKVDGILVQKPAAQRFLEVRGGKYTQFTNWWSGIAESIPVAKDVDGLAPVSLFHLQQLSEQTVQGKCLPVDNLDDFILPATAQAVIDIALDLSWQLTALRQKKVMIIGRSVIVGQPAAYGFRLLGIDCDLISSKSNLAAILPGADLIVCASGQADLIQGNWVKSKAILIDVGAPRPEFTAACYERSASWTPVPGGVGPVTRACLLENLVKLLHATINQD